MVINDTFIGIIDTPVYLSRGGFPGSTHIAYFRPKSLMFYYCLTFQFIQKMKKPIALSFLLLCFFLSCKKSNSGSDSGSYHVTASLDGSAKTFNLTTVATTITNGGYTSVGVTGIASATTGETMSVTITNTPSGKPIVAGTYTDTMANFAIAAAYRLNTTTTYFGATNVTQAAISIGRPVVNHLKIVITSIDASTVKGTFSGDLFLNSDPTAAKKTVTSGDFYAKFQ